MNRSMRRATLLGALVSLLAVLLMACGDDGGSSSAEVAGAIGILDNAGLHAIDESVNTKKEIPATAQTTALHMQTLVLVTEWPSDLKEPAKKLAALFGTMSEVLDTPQPDMSKAGPAVKAAHDAAHDFSREVWAYLAKEAGLEHSVDDGH